MAFSQGRLVGIIKGVTNLFDAIVNYIIIPIVVVLVFVNVIMRYVFNSPIDGGNELAGLLLLLFFVAVLPAVTQSDAHVRMELVYELMPDGIRRRLRMIGHVCGLIFCGVIAWGFLAVKVPHQLEYAQDTMTLRLLLWPFSLFAGLCFAFVSIQYALLVAGFALEVDRSNQTVPDGHESQS